MWPAALTYRNAGPLSLPFAIAGTPPGSDQDIAQLAEIVLDQWEAAYSLGQGEFAEPQNLDALFGTVFLLAHFELHPLGRTVNGNPERIDFFGNPTTEATLTERELLLVHTTILSASDRIQKGLNQSRIDEGQEIAAVRAVAVDLSTCIQRTIQILSFFHKMTPFNPNGSRGCSGVY